MTPDRWVASNDPEGMLRFLCGPGSDRKCRLFCCACCRRLWDLAEPPEHLRKTLEGVELSVEGQLVRPEDYPGINDFPMPITVPQMAEAFGHCGMLERPAFYCAGRCVHEAAGAARSRALRVRRKPEGPSGSWPSDRDYEAARWEEQAAQAHLLRDIFQPFHAPVIAPAWLAWEGGTVVRLAEAAYQERALGSGNLNIDRLGVLADALEEVGCDDEELLAHLRQPGPHVRGCWAVDSLLKKG